MVHLRSIEVPEENFNDFMRAVNANGNVAYDQNGTATYTDPLERDVIKQYVNNYEVIDPRTRMPRAIEWQDYGDRSTQIVNDLTMLTTARYMHNSELGEDFYTLGDSGYDMDNYFGAAALFYNLFNQ